MSRATDLDRAYSLLVRLCDYDQHPHPGTSHARMAAFNLVSALHTPDALVPTERNAEYGELLAQSTELLTALARTATNLGEALSLGTAAALLDGTLLEPRDRQ